MQLLLKESAWALTGHTSLLFGIFFAVKVLSKDMGPSSYGEFALGVSIAQLFQTFFFGSKFDGIVRFGALVTEKNDRLNYGFNVGKILVDASKKCLLTGLVIASLVYLILGENWASLTLAAISYAVTSGVSTALGGVANALREQRTLALSQGTESWAKAFFALGLIKIFEAKAVAALLGYALACGISLILLSFWLGKKFKSEIRLPKSGRGDGDAIRNYTRSFEFVGVFLWLQSYSDRWALKYFASLSEVGIYSVAFTFGYSPIVALVNLTMQVSVPVIYRNAGEFPEFSSYKNILRPLDFLAAFMMLLAGILAMLALCLKDLAVLVLYGDTYRGAADLMPILLLAGGLFAVGESKVVFLNAIKKNRLQILPKISLSIFNFVLAGLLALKFGAVGVAYSLLIASLIYACWMWRITHIACQE